MQSGRICTIFAEILPCFPNRKDFHKLPRTIFFILNLVVLVKTQNKFYCSQNGATKGQNTCKDEYFTWFLQLYNVFPQPWRFWKTLKDYYLKNTSLRLLWYHQNFHLTQISAAITQNTWRVHKLSWFSLSYLCFSTTLKILKNCKGLFFEEYFIVFVMVSSKLSFYSN